MDQFVPDPLCQQFGGSIGKRKEPAFVSGENPPSFSKRYENFLLSPFGLRGDLKESVLCWE
jgi:hypothetical protein